MAPGRSSRKSDQKGVEAIFSSTKEPRQSRAIFGGLILLAGITFLIASVIMVQFPNTWGRSAVESYGSIGFASIGVFVLTCGVGIIVSGFLLSYPSRPRATSRDSNSDSMPKIDVVRDTPLVPSSSLSSPNLKLALTVFLQGCILLALYAGLVDEYQSNPTMQAWVRSSIDSAQYLLNWEALLASAILAGVLVIYSLFTKSS